MCLSSGLRVISISIALTLWIKYVAFTSFSLGCPSLAYVSLVVHFLVFVLSPFLSFISFSLPSQKCLKVHCHCHHGNCHFCDAETCSCLLFRHHCWLTMCAYEGVRARACVAGLCVYLCVFASLCVSNQCFSHVYIFPLCCSLQSIPWQSLTSAINKLLWTARLRELHYKYRSSIL